LHGKDLLNFWNTVILFAALISMFVFLIFNRKATRARFG
jgi:hypothetical protein